MDRNGKGFSTFMRESIAYYLKLIKLFFVSLRKMWYLPVIGLVLVAYIWLFAFKSGDGGFEGRAIYPYNYLDKQFYSILFDELTSITVIPLNNVPSIFLLTLIKLSPSLIQKPS